MMTPFHRAALIVGAGHGLSAALARRLAREGMLVALAARNVDKIAEVAEQTGAATYPCDATDPAAVRRLFAQAESRIGVPDLVVYNAGFRVRGALVDIEPEAAREALIVNAYGAFLVAQEAARRMIERATARSFSPAPRRASKATQSRRRSRWASSRCAGSPRAWRANSRRTASTSPTSSSTGGSRPRPHRGPQPAGLAARSRGDRRDLPARAAPAAQRLDVGVRTPAVGGAVLRRRRQDQSRDATSAVSLRIIASPNLPKSSIGSTKAPVPPITLSR